MIVLVDHDPQWKNRFEQEAGRLASVFDAGEFKAINHVGSTAVPGIKAKPVIDISIGVNTLHDRSHYEKQLSETGYRHSSGNMFEQWMLFARFKEIKFHLHIIPWDSTRYGEQLVFRNAMRASVRLAKAYERYKLLLKEEDDFWYTLSKGEFLEAFFNRKNELPAGLRNAILVAAQETAEKEETRRFVAAILMRFLRQRFGPLPPEIETRVNQADQLRLEVWCIRVLDAAYLPDVFRDD